MAEEIEFEWDDANTKHIARHNVDRADVQQVFANGETAIGYEVVEGEQRWTAVGHTDQMRVLIVSWTMRGETIRSDHGLPGIKIDGT